jgi:hypothetical protein
MGEAAMDDTAMGDTAMGDAVMDDAAMGGAPARAPGSSIHRAAHRARGSSPATRGQLRT